MKRFFFNRIAFTLAVVALFLIGMLRDPDMANADDLDTGPISQERMPGYQCMPDVTESTPLTKDEIAKRNASPEEAAPTF